MIIHLVLTLLEIFKNIVSLMQIKNVKIKIQRKLKFTES